MWRNSAKSLRTVIGNRRDRRLGRSGMRFLRRLESRLVVSLGMRLGRRLGKRI